MSNTFYNYIIGACLILFVGCTPSMEYKYQNKPKVVSCDGLDSDLMHEALYSFEDDIETYYNIRKMEPGSQISIQYGYSNFVYLGARGEADYAGITTEHSREVFRVLKSDTDLYIQENGTIQLDYNHPFVQCLISKIQNQEIKSTMQSLIGVGSMSSDIIASPIRINSRDAVPDKYFAMYLALDTYYKFLDQEPREPVKTESNHQDHDH